MAASSRYQESRAQSGLVPVPALGTPQTVCHIEWPPLHPMDKHQTVTISAWHHGEIRHREHKWALASLNNGAV